MATATRRLALSLYAFVLLACAAQRVVPRSSVHHTRSVYHTRVRTRPFARPRSVR